MKKLFVSAIALAAFAVAAPATAAEYNINLQSSGLGQLQNGAVTQRALSVAAAVGSTANDVDVTSTAISAAQLGTLDLDIGQGSGGMINGNALGSSVNQTLNGAVDQASASLAGTGGLGAGSLISSTTANLGQSATVNVRVRH